LFLRPPFKIHGGKRYLYPWITSLFPKDYEKLIYGEFYCGAGSVFLNKQPSKLEWLNDLDPGVAVIYRVLKTRSEEFIERLKEIKYEEKTFLKALAAGRFLDEMDYAVNEFILRRMSRDGLKKCFAWSERLRGGKPGDVNAWETILGVLPKIAERLQNVTIFNRPAIDMIKLNNTKGSLLYLDPPYLPETRTTLKAYEFEMTNEDHEELAQVLKKFKGKVLISGYYSETYRKLYQGWRCEKRIVANHASQKKIKSYKIECVWLNY
jgi:DNA adenine methylase